MKRNNIFIALDDKINDLDYHAGIDTIQFRSFSKVDYTAEEYPFVHTHIGSRADGRYNYYVLNPNKFAGKPIDSYGEYKQAVKQALDRFPADNPELTRIDFRFDSYKDEYRDFVKLNLLLLLLLSEQYTVKNSFYSRHAKRLKQLTVTISNSSFAAENYNKYEEMLNKDASADTIDAGVINRLELRSRKLKTIHPIDISLSMEQEFTEFYLWLMRLNKSITASNLDALTDELNGYILEEYQYWKDSCSRGHRISTFFALYSNAIFTREQFRKLYDLMEIPNGQTRSRDYLINHDDIQLFDIDNLLLYRDVIADAAERFLCG